jgi:Phage-related protein
LATVRASLQLFDRFSQNINRANQAMQTMNSTIERLKQSLQARISLEIDINAALAHVEQMKERIRTMGGSSAIHVVININDVLQRVTQLRQRIHAELTDATVQVMLDAGSVLTHARSLKQTIHNALSLPPITVSLNTTSIMAQLATLRASFANSATNALVVHVNLDVSGAMAQAHTLRSRIIAAIGTISTTLQVHLPPTITQMVENLRALILKLLWAVRRLNQNFPVGSAAQLEAALLRIARLEQRINELQQQLNNRIRNGGSAAGGLLGNLQGIASAYLSVAGATRLLHATIGGAMEQQKMLDMLIARTGSREVGTAMFEKFKEDALNAGMEVKDALTGVLSFFSMTRNTDQISELNNIAQRLTAFDTTGQGLSGAVFSVKEAMSGDLVSLAERFNMNKAQMRSVGLDTAAKKGDMAAFIQAFNKLLEMQSMGKKAYETMLNSPAKKWEILLNRLKSAFADAGQSAVQALLPLINLLNRAFEEGKFKDAFGGLQAGLSLFAAGTASVVGFLIDHWTTVQNVLLTVGAVLGWLAVMWLVQWAAAAWPVLAVITGIVLLMEVLNHFGISTSQIVGFVGGVFALLFAYLQNNFAVFWNSSLAVAEFFGNVFIDPVYAIKKLFYDLMKTVTDYMGDMVNNAIRNLNWLIEKINSISGTTISLVQEFDQNKWVEGFKPETHRDVFDLSKYQMEHKNLGEAFEKGKQFSLNALSTSKDLASGFNRDDILAKWNTNPQNINRVNEVGKINDKVDIASEDLKVMRELAEMKNIQNFVTLTPTVQVQTGDINNGHDVDTIIRRIEQHLEEEFVASAQGVYT